MANRFSSLGHPSTSERGTDPGPPHGKTSVEFWEERRAWGEVDREAFEEGRSRLLGGGGRSVLGDEPVPGIGKEARFTGDHGERVEFL